MVVDDSAQMMYSQASEEEATSPLESPGESYPTEIRLLHAHIDELEKRIEAMQEEIKLKEEVIKNQQVDIAELQEVNSRGRTEKRRLEEQLARHRGDLSAQENKLNLFKTGRIKIEQELTEAQENIAKERRLRADLEKTKRKLEMDVKTALSDYSDVKNEKMKLEEIIRMKDQQIAKLQSREETISIENGKINRKLEDLRRELEDKNDEVEKEHDLRTRAEKTKIAMQNELNDLHDALQEAQQAATINIDTVRRRDGELEKFRHDLQDLTDKHDEMVDQLKKKHSMAIEEMGKQMEQIKLEKNEAVKRADKQTTELINVRDEYDRILREKEKQATLTGQLEERLEDYRRQVQDLTSTVDEMLNDKKKYDQDVKGLTRMLDENSTLIGTLTKAKEQLQAHLEHARHQIDEESRSRISLAAELRTVGTELDSTKCQLEDELEAKAEMERDLLKLSSSLDQWRKRFETERFERMREVEDVRSKLESKCNQLEDQLDQANSKTISLERIREKLQAEIEDLLNELEKANANVVQLERKHKRFDKLIEEWKQKCENTSTELAASQNEAKYLTDEIIKSNDQYAEAQEQIESLRRENRNLSEEIKSLMDQISENARDALDFDIERKKLEKEKEELRVAVDDALSAKDESDAKIRMIAAEKEALEGEHRAAMKEQEEDLLAAKRQVERQVDALQICLEAEGMARREAIAQRDRLQTTISELTSELELKAESINELNNLLARDRDHFEQLEAQLREETLATSLAKEAEIAANRKVRALQADIDSLKADLNATARNLENVETELSLAKSANNDLASQNGALNNRLSHNESVRLKLELDLEEKVTELHALEERCTKLSSDVVRLGEKLTIEEEHSADAEKKASDLEVLLIEATDRAENAKADAMKACKSTIQRLEDQFQQKQGEYAILCINYEELRRNVSKHERKIKELQGQLQISNQHNDQLVDQNEGLQAKLKLYRKQAEQAEEEAAQSLSRYKAMKDDLERAEGRADRAENMINKYRAASRFGVATGIPAEVERRSNTPYRDGRSMTRNL